MHERKNFNTDKAPRLNDIFPQAVIAGNLIFLSGMAGVAPRTGKLISDSFEEQARQAFLNIRIILEEAGGKLTDLFGESYRYDVADLQNHGGIVATNGVSHDAVIKHLRPILNKLGRSRTRSTATK